MHAFGADVADFNEEMHGKFTLNGDVPVADVRSDQIPIERVEGQEAAIEFGGTRCIEAGKRRRGRIEWELIGRRQIRIRIGKGDTWIRAAELQCGQLEKWL